MILDQAHFAPHQQIRTADIEVIATTTRTIFQRPASAIIAEFQPEADSFQSIQQWFVQFARLVCQDLVRLLHDRKREGHIDQITVFQSRSLAVINAIIKLRAGFHIHDQRRAALHHGYLGAIAMQILRNVMRAGAGAENINRLALPFRAILEARGMHNLPLEAIKCGNIRQARRAADAGCHDDVARAHDAFAAISLLQPCHPALRRRIIRGTFETRFGPEIYLHCLDIGFEPIGDLVLRDIFRPGLRKGQEG